MLRWKIGDEAFYRGMKNYLQNSRYTYGFAVSQDFISEMEIASSMNLQEFFDDWLYGQGYPSYTISWRQQLNNDLVQMKISQSTSHPSSYKIL
jgi:aminopeptidase N